MAQNPFQKVGVIYEFFFFLGFRCAFATLAETSRRKTDQAKKKHQQREWKKKKKNTYVFGRTTSSNVGVVKELVTPNACSM